MTLTFRVHLWSNKRFKRQCGEDVVILGVVFWWFRIVIGLWLWPLTIKIHQDVYLIILGDQMQIFIQQLLDKYPMDNPYFQRRHQSCSQVCIHTWLFWWRLIDPIAPRHVHTKYGGLLRIVAKTHLGNLVALRDLLMIDRRHLEVSYKQNLVNIIPSRILAVTKAGDGDIREISPGGEWFFSRAHIKNYCMLKLWCPRGSRIHIKNILFPNQNSIMLKICYVIRKKVNIILYRSNNILSSRFRLNFRKKWGFSVFTLKVTGFISGSMLFWNGYKNILKDLFKSCNFFKSLYIIICLRKYLEIL